MGKIFEKKEDGKVVKSKGYKEALEKQLAETKK